MAKRVRLVHSEKGQSIVIVAIVMIGMLALAGLAIDGGNIYLHRRRVQNAADSGAMASTRELAWLILQCAHGTAGDDGQVLQALIDYLATNGYSGDNGDEITAYYVDKDESRLGEVGGGSIPNSATGVEVLINATLDTYFLKAVGIDSSRYAATATAMTGKVIALTAGLLPIGVPVEVAEALDKGDQFNVIETNQPNGGMFCEDVNHNGMYDHGDLCIGDPENESAHRGWLNLNYIYNTEYASESSGHYRTFETALANRGCGPYPEQSIDDGIVGWAGDGCPYPFPVYGGDVGTLGGDFIHGSPGARRASSQEVVQVYNGRIAYIPLFDFIYTADYMEDLVADGTIPGPEGIGWPTGGGGGDAFLYHIVGYTAVEINDSRINDSNLTGAFQDAVVGAGQIEPGNGIGSGICHPVNLYGVNLWK